MNKQVWNMDEMTRAGLKRINPLNAELNSICHLLALLGAHHILHVSRIKVNYSEAKSLSHCRFFNHKFHMN
jgi:hypothetical protein